MQVTNHSNNKRKMKEELLEAIYGTVERLEQKVDELSASPKNAGAETVLSPANVDTSKLEKAILAMAVKEGESIDKLARLREAICIFTDLTKKEASNGEQRSKLLFDAINQVKQELNATSKNVQEKLHAMGNTPQKKDCHPSFRAYFKVCSSFHWWLGSIPCNFHLGQFYPMARAPRLGEGRLEVSGIEDGSSI